NRGRVSLYRKGAAMTLRETPEMLAAQGGPLAAWRRRSPSRKRPALLFLVIRPRPFQAAHLVEELDRQAVVLELGEHPRRLALAHGREDLDRRVHLAAVGHL